MSILVANKVYRDTSDNLSFSESLKSDSAWDHTVVMEFNVFTARFTARCCAERGYATVYCPFVRLSIRDVQVS